MTIILLHSVALSRCFPPSYTFLDETLTTPTKTNTTFVRTKVSDQANKVLCRCVVCMRVGLFVHTLGVYFVDMYICECTSVHVQVPLLDLDMYICTPNVL